MPRQHRGIRAVFRGHRRDFPRQRIAERHIPQAADFQTVILRGIGLAVNGGVGVGNEQIAAAVILPHAIKQPIRGSAALILDADLPHGLQDFIQLMPVPGQQNAFPAEIFRVPGGKSVHIPRRGAQENHLAALGPESAQRVQRGAANGVHHGNDHRAIGHFAHDEFLAWAVKSRQGGFADVIEIQRIRKQPAVQFGKAPVQFGALLAGLVIGAEGDPIGFNGMNHANANDRLSPGHKRIHLHPSACP